jgi:hypothetical protein
MLLEIRGRLSERSWEQVDSSLQSKLINGSVMQRNEKWTGRECNRATWPKYACQFCTNWFVVAYLDSVSEVPVFELDPKTGSVDVFSSCSSNLFPPNADTDFPVLKRTKIASFCFVYVIDAKSRVELRQYRSVAHERNRRKFMYFTGYSDKHRGILWSVVCVSVVVKPR